MHTHTPHTSSGIQCRPDEAHDGRNVALNYQVNCCCARLCKGTILLCYTTSSYVTLHGRPGPHPTTTEQACMHSPCVPTWHHCDRALDVSEGLSGVVLHQAGDEGALSNPGRTNHGHYHGRRLQRRPVHHRQVVLLGLHVQRAPSWSSRPNGGLEREGFDVLRLSIVYRRLLSLPFPILAIFGVSWRQWVS